MKTIQEEQDAIFDRQFTNSADTIHIGWGIDKSVSDKFKSYLHQRDIVIAREAVNKTIEQCIGILPRNMKGNTAYEDGFNQYHKIAEKYIKEIK